MKERRIIFFVGLVICITSAILLMPLVKAVAQQEAPQPSVNLREDFSEKELQAFLKAHEKVTEIQKEDEKKIIKAIDDQGLTVDRFQEILEAQHDPQKRAQTSPDDLSSFNNAAQVIIEENKKAEEEMATTIEKEGIDLDTYQQIILAYQQSPTVQRRVNALMNGEK